MKGMYPCPKCGKNDWTPVTWVDGPPYDECNGCGYHFTSNDIPKNRWNKFWEEIEPESIDGNSNIAWQWVRNILLGVKAVGDDIVSINEGFLTVRKEYLDRVDSLKEREERIEKISKFLDEGGKELAYDLGASQHMINQMNQIQKMCRKATDETDEKVLTALPHRILQILGIPTCPACGFVASKSPCKYCGNDTGMEEGTG